jgi:steroid 5-alpha reductase family enzyme
VSGEMLSLAVAVLLVMAMAGAWVLQKATKNAGWVDVVWSISTGAGGVMCAVVPWPGEPGLTARQLVVALMAAAWSLRLGLHIADRTRHGPEDVRYAGFRREWGADFQRRMFWFLMIQAAAAWLLTVSMQVAARNPAPGLRLQDGLGILLLCCSVIGEGVADAQLRAFRASMRPGGGAVCDRGLWGWSRHPNYFFEWLGWCAYALLAIDVSGQWPAGFLALSGPAFMFWLLRYVSGVPPLEAAMLASRGDGFRAYQARVSAFFPLPPRS